MMCSHVRILEDAAYSDQKTGLITHKIKTGYCLDCNRKIHKLAVRSYNYNGDLEYRSFWTVDF